VRDDHVSGYVCAVARIIRRLIGNGVDAIAGRTGALGAQLERPVEQPDFCHDVTGRVAIALAVIRLVATGSLSTLSCCQSISPVA
jgi:hypothetical protein